VVGIIQSTEGQSRTKVWKKSGFSFLELGQPFYLALRYQSSCFSTLHTHKLKPSPLLVLESSDLGVVVIPSTTLVSGLWIWEPPDFLGL
jgi:hypothetical protein